MKKIDVSLIKKYINGEEIKNIEELENDKEFMISVIDYTNDLSTYNLCSKELKKDYMFVKYLIIKFKEDYNSIINIADNFLDLNNYYLDRMELCILMEELLPDNLNGKYKEINEISYIQKRTNMELAKIKDNSLEPIIGVGFWLILDDYKTSDVILKYFAKHLLDDIIEENNIDLEKMLHTEFNSPDKILQIGINNYLINFIGYYDSILGSFVSSHLDLLNNLVDNVNKIINNWDNYEIIDESINYYNAIDMVHEYFLNANGNMLEVELLYYVAKELGISDKISYYEKKNILNDYLDFNFEDEIDYNFIQDEINSDIRSKLDYLNVRKIMINQIFSKNPADLSSIIDKKRNNKSKKKILKNKNNSQL